MVVVDEAHRHGLLRRAMAAACSRKRASRTRSISSIGTFSKIGRHGRRLLVSNHPKFEVLRLVCRPYVFTASLPPSVVATAATSIRKLMHAGDKRAHLWKNSRASTRACATLGFKLATQTPQSAIIAVILPDPSRRRG